MITTWFYRLMALCAAAACAACGVLFPAAPEADMPNPASVYCQDHGGRLEMRQDASGGTAGVCVFEDGSACDEWAFFRGECQPGDLPAGQVRTPAAGLPEGWQLYEDPTVGLQFALPPGTSVETAGDTQESLYIAGPPNAAGEDWPAIWIDHPSGREEFHPPEGAPLAEYLEEHYLALAGERQPDLRIAGSEAVHTRQEGSPQSYAADRFFFVHNGQLYTVLILHTGRQEDWDLYGRFMGSIAFTR